jgi:hypothetical protein
MWLAAAASAAEEDYQQQLLAQAERQHLWDDRYWQILLHYESDVLGRWHSTATTPWFFRAPDGKSNPRAELNATLLAFFDDQPITPHQEPAVCVYPARYAWLKQRLDIDTSRLPAVDCAPLQEWLAQTQITAANLVFADAYVNSPASMFGHTLLRLESARYEAGKNLLSYAVNFSANTQEKNGIVFDIKGIMGYYRAVFVFYYYFYKLRDYSFIENRDLWEYSLVFSPDQLQPLMLHLWELRGVEFDYYFFRQNCSYQLLWMLQTAAPEARLTEPFHWWATPIDTVKQVKRAGLTVGPMKYRPAAATILRHRLDQLSAERRSQVLDLTAGRLAIQAPEIAALPPQERAQLLEIAHDVLEYRYQVGLVPRDEGLQRALDLLKARSQIPLQTPPVAVPRPPVAPDEGHGTGRIAAGMIHEGGSGALDLDWRAAYHDLLDAPQGYPQGSQIAFFEANAAWWPQHDSIRLNTLKVIDILSLDRREDFYAPTSWGLSFGLRRLETRPLWQSDAALGAYLEGGQGLTYGLGDNTLAYGLLMGSLDVRPALARDYRIGYVPRLGLTGHWNNAWSWQAELSANQPLLGQRDRYRKAALGQQWHIQPDLGLRLELSRSWTDEGAYNLIGLSVMKYW